jgi:alkanesulfonate monooxygenase SsuD/methylene tetrahydromethanopterin reductase-like flavin-dependent oxidoreductase (luciferase family)
MRYGLDISPVGPWGDPRTIADLAGLAERSGWDGVFVEDYVFFHDGSAAYDPWITLAAIALATERIALATMVTPLPRRRVWKVAAEAMTIDHLSGGRLAVGVGLGDPNSADNRSVGEAVDARTRARMLDESLDVLTRLWTGEPVTFQGDHVAIHGATLRPRPVQRPRIPIWVGGCLHLTGPRARALRWDGACLYAVPPDQGWRDLSADEVRDLHSTARERRGDDDFVVLVGGRARREDLDAETEYVTGLARAGATWWHEYIPPSTPLATAKARIEAGPVRAVG